MKRINRKNILIFAAAAALSSGAFCQTQNVSESSLYNEINSAYATGFLPGVIEKASDFERKYPESAYINDIRMQKARALVSAKQNDGAIETLEQLIQVLSQNKENPSVTNDIPECYFLMGRAYYEKGQYNKALSSFYMAAKLLKEGNSRSDFYAYSILYAGRIYFNQDNFTDAIPQFEFAVSNGDLFARSDFNEALQKLVISYNESGKADKATALFKTISASKENFDPQFYYTTAVYAAQGYEKLKNYQKAYDLYCEVIDAKIESLSVIALKKAYLLADQKKVPVNPGEAFSRNTSSFDNQKELVLDFWIRLGIDEFDGGNYSLSEKYFDNAALLLEEGVKGERALVCLYQAKLQLKEEPLDKSKLEQGKKTLMSNEALFKKSNLQDILDSYYSTLIQFDQLLGNWNDVISNYEKLKNPDSKSAYFAASYFYDKKNYAQAENLLEGFLSDPLCKKLYASCCLNLKDAKKAVTLYLELEKDGKLDDLSALEYAKALFLKKDYSLAYEKAGKVKNPQASYIGGLCLINLKKWESARDSFNSYIKEASAGADFYRLSFFYKGYAEYNLGEFKNAYASFVRFTSEASDDMNTYLRQACDFAVKSALQNGDMKNASLQAEKLVRISQTREEKQEALLLNAQIYADSGNSQKAVEVLTPFTSEKSDFALQALYQIAQIYEKEGDLGLAEANLEKIMSKSPRSTYAEEACYHEGEMYYSKKEYSASENRFNKYIYKYADGKYADAALFYCADCNYRLSSYEKAIMLCLMFTGKFPQSIYSYGVYTTLLNAYNDEQDYENALATANNLLKLFPEQAASDGIGKRAAELKRLVSGADKQIAQKVNEFEKHGKTSTREGRKIASELVKLYLRNPETEEEGIKLAEEILPLQTGDDEKELFAQNTSLIAEYARKNNDNKTSAQHYLDAAAAYRACGNSEKAAESLYSAAEAFAAAKLKGDARETAKTLKELYPQSHYAVSVDRITGN